MNELLISPTKLWGNRRLSLEQENLSIRRLSIMGKTGQVDSNNKSN
jgi:hypothetical protein